ncbi:MAG TPA: 4-alpha-glucanotransferase [Candidatus Sulfotelmatobacter sp.]|nr:4-alpha-glucanotransferase [Candidatus Sulfotelmatobacter sp.]
MISNGARALPLAANCRASGVLLHVTSLPSPYGIGDFGPTAFSWIERLRHAQQSFWQALPMGPVGYDNSPYQPLSSFARNVLLISPDWLIEDELLTTNDCAHDPFPAAAVDYGAVRSFKHRLMGAAWKRFKTVRGQSKLRIAFEQFCHAQKHWLDDYALFQTLKAKFGEIHYLQWPTELVNRNSTALERARRELADEIGKTAFAQFLVFLQADRLKAHAHKNGLSLIGDLPFFVSGDSSDVWSSPELFLLDEQRRPRFVAGVPPDYFSARGQLWGNPLYDWKVLRQSGYQWWIARLRSLLTHADVIRLDHFRGFAAAWHIPAGAATAVTGSWAPGPGAEFLAAAGKELGRLPFIAEDLGMITPDVYALREQFHLPGMRVLQFAFDGDANDPHLPENFATNTVVYTGTHDNPTTRGWFEGLTADRREKVWNYLKQRGVGSSEAAHGLIELAWSSKAELAMAPLQDLLNLGKEARMNIPGRPERNWRWRCTEEMLSDEAFAWLGQLTKNAGRFEVSDSREREGVEAASRC